MKIIVKKPLRFTVITTLCLVAITLFVAGGCVKTEYHTVNFTGKGIAINSQSIEHGKHASKPENPEREGYNFGGWFTDADTFADEWDFETDIVTRDTILYAKWEENNLQNYPIEIPFTEYSLAETFCQWTNFDYDYANFANGKILILNSNEELTNYINCMSGNYPEIDFDKYSLIIAWGVANNSINNIEKQLLQTGNSQYDLSITIELGYHETLTKWLTAILLDKLSDNTNITLSTNIVNTPF